MSHNSNNDKVFLTGWAGYQTFEQIYESVTPILKDIMYSYGGYDSDVADGLQTSMMRIWERLQDEPDYFAEMSRRSAAFKLACLSKISTLQKQANRYLPFSLFEDGSDFNVDEYGIGRGVPNSEWWNKNEHWASWATRLDSHMDIRQAIETVVGEFGDDMKKYVALYVLTTDVPAVQTINALGVKRSQVYARMTQIKARLQELLADYAPPQNRHWQERLQAGEVAPYLQIIEKYKDTPQALRAIYTLTTNVKVLEVMLSEGERSMLIYYRKKCNREIARAYRQAA